MVFLLLKLGTAGLFVYTLADVAKKTSFLITSTNKDWNMIAHAYPLYGYVT